MLYLLCSTLLCSARCRGFSDCRPGVGVWARRLSHDTHTYIRTYVHIRAMYVDDYVDDNDDISG